METVLIAVSAAVVASLVTAWVTAHTITSRRLKDAEALQPWMFKKREPVDHSNEWFSDEHPF